MRACVGSARYCGMGTLFGERRLEVIGVQLVGNQGLSGGPLISYNDESNTFMGVGIPLFGHVDEAISTDAAGDENGVNFLGTSFLTVDHPAITAIYLHFILPRYSLSIPPLVDLMKMTFHLRYLRISIRISDSFNGT